MTTNKKTNYIDVIFYVTTIFIILFAMFFKIYSYTFLGIYLLIYNIYLLLKYRETKKMFILFFIILFFNYSFIISRYIGTPSSLLNEMYLQLRNKESLLKAILLILSMLTIIDSILRKEKYKEIQIEKIDFKYRKILILIMQITLIAILVFHLVNSITNATTLLEYSIFIFIFCFFLSKYDHKNRIITELILLAFAIYSIKNGDRIAILQILIVDFLINYIDKLKYKTIIALICVGIVIFTLFGLYGDILEYNGQNFEAVNIQNTIKQLQKRRLALDTSISAYFTSTSMIDVADQYSVGERITDGFDYLIRGTIMGKRDSTPLPYKIKTYQNNYGGGFITGYFYYWFGYIGVAFISIYLGCVIKKSFKSDSIYGNMITILIISTVPRWYMYEPNFLFRGILMFSVFYYIIKKIFMKGIKYESKTTNNGNCTSL